MNMTGGSALGWGIWGAGVMGHRFASDLRLTQSGRLVAVASRDRGRAESCRAAGGAARRARLHADGASLLDDPAVGAVYIALPTHLHEDALRAALAAGKPVLCEKPLLPSVAAARAVAALARESGVFCMESLWTRFLPVTRMVRAELQAGRLGEIVALRADLGFARRGGTDSKTDPALGGGALFDLGVYPLSLARHFLGPLRLEGAALRLSPNGAEREIAASLSAGPDGVPVAICVSHGGQLGNTLEITGTLGRIVIEAPFIAANAAHCARVPAPSAGGHVPPSRIERLRGLRPVKLLRRAMLRSGWFDGRNIGTPYPGNGLQFVADEVAQCLQLGLRESPLMPLGESIEVLEIIEAIRHGAAIPTAQLYRRQS